MSKALPETKIIVEETVIITLTGILIEGLSPISPLLQDGSVSAERRTHFFVERERKQKAVNAAWARS